MISPDCCSFYSFTGLLFMTFVYILLSTQPFFVTGIDDVPTAKSNAIGALITFGVTFAISVALIMRRGRGDREYDIAANGGEDYNRLNIDLKKNYGGGQVYGSVATDSY